MCGRVELAAWNEMLQVARQLGASMPESPQPDWPAQARPGAQLPVLGTNTMPRAFALPIWGYLAPWNGRLVYNTRIESAGSTMWAASFAQGRAVVPVHSFFEPHATETQHNPDTGRMGKRSYRFCNADDSPLLLGAVCQDGRASIVTTQPNASVAPIHHRMPLVLAPGEVDTWLGPGWRALADRSGIGLLAAPEHPDSTGHGSCAPEQPNQPEQLTLF